MANPTRSILWWEYNELLDHLVARPDIWSESADSPGLWLRSDSAGDSVMGLLLVPPIKSGTYRQYAVRTVPLSWPTERCNEYLDELLRHWTSYLFRLETTKLLQDELNLDIRVAESMAIAIARLGQIEFDPDAVPQPSQKSLEDITSGFPDDRAYGLASPHRLFLLSSGGYVRLRPRGGMLAVDLSLKVDGSFTGSGQLTGFVRPQNGNLQGTFNLLFGLGEPEPKTSEVSDAINASNPVLHETADAGGATLTEGQLSGTVATDARDQSRTDEVG